MRIGGLQKFSLIDYPGKVAGVIFTQGCNWRCSYCYNKALVLPECYQPPLSESKVWSFLNKRRGLLEGIVVTGGEPTLQKDLAGFLGQIKAMRFKVKLDTNGSRPEILESLIQSQLVDYLAMDIKTSFLDYERLAGARVNVASLKKSIRIIQKSGIDHHFRTTQVKGFCSGPILDEIRWEIQGSRYVLQEFLNGDTLAGHGISQ